MEEVKEEVPRQNVPKEEAPKEEAQDVLMSQVKNAKPVKKPNVALERFTVTSRHVRGRHSRQLRRHSTSEEPQYQDLRRMNKAFCDESLHGGSFILGQATFSEKRVYFILCKGERVGYVSMEESVPHDILPNMPDLSRKVNGLALQAPRCVPILPQLFVQPSHRGCGILHITFQLA